MSNGSTFDATDSRPDRLPPLVPGWPVLGNALDLRIDPLEHLTGMHRRYGPAFRIKVPGRTIWVMAGLAANEFLARDGERYLGSEETFGPFGAELGSDALMVALDGVPHRHQRKVQRRGYSRKVILAELGLVDACTRAAARRWVPGQSFGLFEQMQEVVVEQLGIMIAGRPAHGLLGDLRILLNTNLRVNVLKTSPRVVLRSPRYRRAYSRVMAFGDEVLEWHRRNPPAASAADERVPNLVDDLLAAVDETGQPYSRQMLLTSIAGAYFAGLDTVASSVSFLLAAILRTSGLQQTIAAEADAAFGAGDLTPASLQAMTTLHDTTVEALRRYPVAPFTPRTVNEAFDFGGYRFPPGADVFVAQAVTHLLDEYFADPLVFNPHRATRDGVRKTPMTYAPFTLGAHTCLGAGLAELQMMAIVAVLLHEVELELDRPDRPIKVHATPLPNPGRLRVRVVTRRVAQA